jgi:hypothetical protein
LKKLNKKIGEAGVKRSLILICDLLDELCKMKISIIFTILFGLYLKNCNAITDRDFYNVNAPGSTSLQRDNDVSQEITLKSPIHFYGDNYDSIFVSFDILIYPYRSYTNVNQVLNDGKRNATQVVM